MRRWACSMFYSVDGQQLGINFNVDAITMMLAVAEWHKRCTRSNIDPTKCFNLHIYEIN